MQGEAYVKARVDRRLPPGGMPYSRVSITSPVLSNIGVPIIYIDSTILV